MSLASIACTARKNPGTTLDVIVPGVGVLTLDTYGEMINGELLAYDDEDRITYVADFDEIEKVTVP